ncbi:MAG TPA: DUF72 domain-containing protein [Candidatus Krumholzibacterium sp.]|nr:DUF72 domain-containing protein [Candidatus Krumholzibacterium sp.]
MALESDKRGRLYIGPAGWSYADWDGIVYPPSTRLDRLLFISRYFNCIELNSSFYRMPSSTLVDGWTRRLSDVEDFLLNVKVLGRYTHQRAFDETAIMQFIERFDPLLAAERLGAFLLQFPWSFRFTGGNADYLEKIAACFRDRPAAIEVRHGSWDAPEARDIISGNGLIYCNIDQPVIGRSLPPGDLVTVPGSGYIRLHGRNYDDWFREGAGRDARYDYLYSEEEMTEWRERASGMLSRVNRLFVITNNHFRGQALVNAFQLKSMLTGEKVEVPSRLRRAYPVLERYSGESSDEGSLF